MVKKARTKKPTKQPPALHPSVRWTVRLLVGVWAAFWAYFLGAHLVEAVQTPASPERSEGLMYASAGLLVVLGITWLGFSGRRVATPMLIMLGAIIMIGYYFNGPPQMQAGTKILTALELGLPLFAAGLLLLIGRRK